MSQIGYKVSLGLRSDFNPTARYVTQPSRVEVCWKCGTLGRPIMYRLIPPFGNLDSRGEIGLCEYCWGLLLNAVCTFLGIEWFCNADGTWKN